ncbi:hypothetical protein VTH82DRAFT_6759 [Thermothelomyces myriococcoides]
MPSYLITGISRGIGYEFLRQCSSNPNDTVIGIVRDKVRTLEKISKDPDLKGRGNIHILQADLVDYASLKAAAKETANITGGSLDYLIANAALVSQFDAYDPIGDLGEQPDLVTMSLREYFEINVISNIHLFNLFVPLIRNGQVKKVIFISSGMADTELVRQYDVTAGPLYSISKAAMNMAVAKFSAQYKQEGILFLSLSPGMVDVGRYKDATPEQLEKVSGLVSKFVAYAPHFKGPITPEESVRSLRSVIANAAIEKGNGGDFLSHYGNKQWL